MIVLQLSLPRFNSDIAAFVSAALSVFQPRLATPLDHPNINLGAVNLIMP